jgi:flavodoxin
MKKFRFLIVALLAVIMALAFAACTDDNGSDNTSGGGNENITVTDETTLVVYFSCTNTTKGRAQQLQEKLGSAIYEIVPTNPYTSADLNYNNSNSRSTKEQNDPTARPAISGSVENIERYTTIYIGYPIWWGQAPKIIYTFLESYEFTSSVTIIPFCTSGGSGMGTSGTNLHGSAPNANWKDGRRVTSESDIDALVNMK